MTDESVRRPTHFERLWLRDIFLVGLSVYAFSKTRTLWQTGYMHGLMKQLTEKIATDAQDHIVEPLTDLSKYLFEKIRKDADLIVTRRELDESRKDLRDMLLDYREKYGIQGIGAQPSQAPAEGEESSPLSLLANTVDKVTGIAKGVVGWLSPDDRDGDKTALSAADKAAEKPMDSQIKKEFNDAFMDARRRVEKAAKSVSLPGKSRAVPTTSSTSSSSSEPPKPAVKKVKVPSVDSAVAAPGPTPSPSSVANVPSHRPSSSSTSSSSSSKSAPASTASDAGVVVSTVDEVSDEMLEYTMDRVMERYKEEVKSPMQGVIFGSLASSSLIQAQKMKVMSESAMLRLDQVSIYYLNVILYIISFSLIFKCAWYIDTPQSAVHFSISISNLVLVLTLYCFVPTGTSLQPTDDGGHRGHSLLRHPRRGLLRHEAILYSLASQQGRNHP